MPRSGWRERIVPPAVAAGVALLPFVRSLVAGECFFFRDAARTFFPLKRYVAESLRAGEMRFWNPYLHEGVALHLSPISYPLDLLHALRPDEAFFTLLLALHVPLGAATCALLVRRIGCGGAAAAGAGILYALGGFSLSTINLYVYTQAMGWAPLVILGLQDAAVGRRRGVLLAAGASFACASTGGIEVVAQTLLIGAALSARRPLRPWAGGLLAAALGVALAAPALFVMSSQLEGSARGAGFPVDVVLSQSVDPWSLPQLVVGNWHGDLRDLANRWWGSNFFPNGFPYILSLYVGAIALSLAAIGCRNAGSIGPRLCALAILGLIVSLGRFAGLSGLVSVLPGADSLRFPVKAFFSVHTSLALLAGFGLNALASRRGWPDLFAWTTAAGGTLVALQALPAIAADGFGWFLRGFLPPSYAWPQRMAAGSEILADAGRGGLVALTAAAMALAVVKGRLSHTRGALLVAALLAADLLRTGAGLNPSVTPSFYELSPEMERVAGSARASGGRVFSCDPESVPAYFQARARLPRHDVWSFALAVEALTPNLNVAFRVPTALSRDLTMMVAEDRVLSPEEMAPRMLPRLMGRLRKAGVTRVLCMASVEAEGMRLIESVRNGRTAPLSIEVYEVSGAEPLHAILGAPGRIHEVAASGDDVSLLVEADAPALLVVRESASRGWQVDVNGVAAPVLTVEDHYRAVAIRAGRSRVRFSYRPPGLQAGLVTFAFALCALGALVWRTPGGPSTAAAGPA